MPSVVFAGSKVKTLKDTLSLNGGADILSVSSDPTSGAGIAAALGSLAMDTSTGKVYRKTGSLDTEWQAVGSGAGGINYIENYDAESGVAGWSTYADAAQATPVDGTGGTPTVQWTRETSTPLRGVADFNFATPGGGSVQGQGVAYDFSVDNADLAKVLTVTFDYEVLSGTYATGDLTVYLIQDPAGTPVVIQPAGYQVQAGTVGTKLKHIATFQTASNVNDYRLCFHVASTSASAYTLAIDNVVVGPQVVQYGAPVTDWVSYTPTVTGFSGAPTVTFKYRRVGDSVEIAGKILKGSATYNAALTFTLPAGLSIDTSKTDNSTFYAKLGTISAEGSGNYHGIIFQNNTSTTSLVAWGDSGLGQWSGATNVPFSSATLVSFQVAAVVPILGWSSTVQMSNDTDTRVVAAKSRRSANQTIPNVTPTVVLFDTTEIDTHGAMNTSGVYTIPVSGIYEISGQIAYAGIPSAAGYDANIRLYVNGVDSDVQGTAKSGTVSQTDTQRFFFRKQLNAGQTVAIRAYHGVAAGLTLLGDTTVTGISALNVVRVSGPSAIAASETVACEYKSSAGNSVVNNTDSVFIDCATKIYDTHGAVVGAGSGNSTTATNTWRFVAPISGKYQVNAGVAINIPAGPNYWLVASIWVNGIKRTTGTFIVTNQWGTLPASGTVSNCINLNAGDYVSLGFYQQSGATRNMWTSSAANYISIVRVGN